MYRKLKNWQKIAVGLLVYDFISICLSYFLALFLRFDCSVRAIEDRFWLLFLQSIPYYALLSIVFYWICRLYNRIWRFVSYRELLRCIIGGGTAIVLQFLVIHFFIGKLPYAYYVFGGIFQMFFLIGSRFSWRFLRLILARASRHKHGNQEPSMLIGGGSTGQLILRDLTTTAERNIKFECIIDDDPNKWGCFIEDVPIIGGRKKIPAAVAHFGIKKIFLAIPTAPAEQKQEILEICQETGCQVKVLPGIFQFTNDEVSLAKMRDVQVEDLLGRQSIIITNDSIFANISDKVVLVTGGGGSIGSELCRQIAMHSPRRLIIFDIYENNAYDIQQELKRKHPFLDLVVLIGSVRDSKRVESVFDTYHPEMVFHAAAHKHVPLMEDSPSEAIKNNVMGTYKVAFAALTHGCKRFLLVSTDKAVNPTNIMGASKRICEMIIQMMDRVVRTGDISRLPHVDSHTGFQKLELHLPENRPHTEFIAVRFGNVLGSNGSVVPLFKKQIAEGGPVTVTDPRIIRYFMTIPEAVSLILQSATYAKGGEIFVLDMGEPVKIDTLARNLIKLSGLKPDIDIKIQYTGLRPGEKLYEEKLMSEEGLQKTENKLIHIAQPIQFDTNEFFRLLGELIQASAASPDDIRDIVARIVPTYHPKSS